MSGKSGNEREAERSCSSQEGEGQAGQTQPEEPGGGEEEESSGENCQR